MRNVFFITFFLGAFVGLSQSLGTRRVQKQLSKREAFQKAQVAVYVAPINTNKTTAEFNSDKYMTPASNTKLLTFLAAQEVFDSLPALYYRPLEENHIAIKSTGYPLLFHPFYSDSTLSHFFNKAATWTYMAPKTVPQPLGPGWSWDDYGYYFAAEKSAFPIYGNSLQATYLGGKIIATPQGFELKIAHDSLAPKLKRNPFQNTFLYNPLGWTENDTLYRPFITSDSLFVKLLSAAIEKPVILKKEEKDSFMWQSLYTHEETILYKALLQDSDNGIAEALLLMIAQKQSGQMKTQIAIDSLKTLWRGWLPDPLEWVDGSGVSRYNMITPRTLGAVLQKIYQKVGWKTIQTFFPKGGVSGTLIKYPVPNLYAKTGTLRHNHNLSGYFLNKHGKPFVFVVMVNHHTAPTDAVKKDITEFMLWLQKKVK